MNKQNYTHFFNQATLQAQQKLVKGYYQQMIMMYGLDVKYFRRNYEFFDPNGLLNLTGNVDWTYGYDSEYSYGNEVNMRGYLELGNDAFIFSMIGADSEQDGKIYFTKEQFELDMLDAVGTVTSGLFSTTFDVDIFGFTGDYNHTENFDAFNITFEDTLNFVESGVVNGSISPTISDIHTQINNDIAGVKSYVHNWIVQGSINGDYIGELDEAGDGTVTISASGVLTYNRPATNAESNGWKIAPQVGDFIRITFGDGTTEDYIFTQVTDRDLQNNGISPFLGKFVWKCQFTRRDFSHESVPSGSIASETFENDYLNQVIAVNDDVSDSYLDYNLDDSVDDKVYGGY